MGERGTQRGEEEGREKGEGRNRGGEEREGGTEGNGRERGTGRKEKEEWGEKRGRGEEGGTERERGMNCENFKKQDTESDTHSGSTTYTSHSCVYLLHGLLACLLDLLHRVWGIDGLVEDGEDLLPQFRQIVTGSQSGKGAHLEGDKRRHQAVAGEFR